MIAELTFVILLTLAFILHEKFRIKDDWTADLALSRQLSKQWHKWKGGVQIIAFAYIAYNCQQRHHVWLYTAGVTLAAGGLFWTLHDGLLNVILFHQYWFHVGTTAALDRLGKNVITAFKIGSIVTGITCLIIWKIYS